MTNEIPNQRIKLVEGSKLCRRQVRTIPSPMMPKDNAVLGKFLTKEKNAGIRSVENFEINMLNHEAGASSLGALTLLGKLSKNPELAASLMLATYPSDQM